MNSEDAFVIYLGCHKTKQNIDFSFCVVYNANPTLMTFFISHTKQNLKRFDLSDISKLWFSVSLNEKF